MLLVRARADHIGGTCADVYFEKINVTGEWAEAAAPGGFRFDAGNGNDRYMARWLHVGAVGLKVVRGHLRDGTVYLNAHFKVKNVSKYGLRVGGLLGEDSHEREATMSSSCQRHLNLLQEL